MHWSVRARTTFSATCVVAATLVVASVVLLVLRHRSLLDDVDARSRLRLQDVVSLVKRDQVPSVTLAGGDDDGTLAQIVSGGVVLVQSPLIRPDTPVARFAPTDHGITIRTVERAPIIGGSSYRVAAQRVRTLDGHEVVVYAASSIEPASDGMHALELLLALAVPGLILLTASTTWLFVGRALRPVESIRRQVADISATALDRRIPEPSTNDEVQLLARTMNTMLGRLEEAATRQRSFVSDAAHELRSPLTSMRAELEIAAARPEVVDWSAFVERLSTTSARIEHLVEDLLASATSEEQAIRKVDVDLDEIVLRRIETLRATTSLAVDAQRIDGARVLGDRNALERVVANLIDNAEEHARTTITVELRAQEGVAELVVIDDGLGVPSHLRERVFDRFVRVDEGRDRRHGGAGLGLSIARHIVEAHNGTIGFADDTSHTRVIVRLPLLTPSGTEAVQPSRP